MQIAILAFDGCLGSGVLGPVDLLSLGRRMITKSRSNPPFEVRHRQLRRPAGSGRLRPPDRGGRELRDRWRFRRGARAGLLLRGRTHLSRDARDRRRRGLAAPPACAGGHDLRLLQRRLPARRGGPARRPALHDDLVALRRLEEPLPPRRHGLGRAAHRRRARRDRRRPAFLDRSFSQRGATAVRRRGGQGRRRFHRRRHGAQFSGGLCAAGPSRRREPVLARGGARRARGQRRADDRAAACAGARRLGAHAASPPQGGDRRVAQALHRPRALRNHAHAARDDEPACEAARNGGGLRRRK